MRVLLVAFSSPAVTDRLGRTPLHVATLRGHADVVRELLASGASVRSLTCRGWTPLHLAAQHGEEIQQTYGLAPGAISTA